MFHAKYNLGSIHDEGLSKLSKDLPWKDTAGGTDTNLRWQLQDMSFSSSQEQAQLSTSPSSVTSAYHVSAMAARQNYSLDDLRPRSLGSPFEENAFECTDFLSCSSVYTPQAISRRGSCSNSPKRPQEYDFFAPMEESFEVSEVDCTLSLGTTASRDHDKTEAMTRQSRSGSPLHPTYSARASARLLSSQASLTLEREPERLTDKNNENLLTEKLVSSAQLASVSSEITAQVYMNSQSQFMKDSYPSSVLHHRMDVTSFELKNDLYGKAEVEEYTKRRHPSLEYPERVVNLQRQNSEQEATSVRIKNSSFRSEARDFNCESLKLLNVSCNMSEGRSRDLAHFTHKGIAHYSHHQDFLNAKASFLDVTRICLDGLESPQYKNNSGGHGSYIDKASSGLAWNGITNGPRNVIRICTQCKTMKTPLWRNGPHGPKSLCNACGIRYKKEEKRSVGCTRNSSPTSSILCYQGSSSGSFKSLKEVGLHGDVKTSITNQQWPCYLDAVSMLLGYQDGKHTGKKAKLTADETAARTKEGDTSSLRWQQSDLSSVCISSKLGFPQLSQISPTISTSSMIDDSSQAEDSLLARDFLSGWESAKIGANDDEAGAVSLIARSCGAVQA